MEALFERYKDWWWARYPKDPERGMKTRFARAANADPRYMSHVWNGRKEIGHGVARLMEQGMRDVGPGFADVVDGWMDNDHSRPKPMRYRDISLHDTLEACFDTNPIETQRAMNELVSRLLLAQVAKQ